MSYETLIVFGIVLTAVLYLAYYIVKGKGCGCGSEHSSGGCCSDSKDKKDGCDTDGSCCGAHKH
ncbi:MAG: FeoB-associated Cys-rich membrane protein [Deferribacterales bacterium]